MENASKALFIAAGVFIGIMLLSVMIYVFRQGARINQTYDQKQINLQLELYNSQFENFDSQTNNIIDVISLCNLAFDANKECDFDKASSVQIEIKIGSKTYILPNSNLITERNLILDGSNKISIYNLVNYTLNEGDQKLGIGTGTVEGDGDLASDKLSDTKLEGGKTIYKYLFKVADSKDFEYNSHSNKVSKIKLTAYCNSEW